jgi:hypothetical protein
VDGRLGLEWILGRLDRWGKWIQLAQDRVQRWANVNAVMNFILLYRVVLSSQMRILPTTFNH